MPDMNRYLDKVGKGFADFLVPPPEGVIRFTVGQPDFITPEGIRDVAIQSLRDGETSYTRPGGSEELCRTVARFLDERCGIEVDWEDVVDREIQREIDQELAAAEEDRLEGRLEAAARHESFAVSDGVLFARSRRSDR